MPSASKSASTQPDQTASAYQHAKGAGRQHKASAGTAGPAACRMHTENPPRARHMPGQRNYGQPFTERLLGTSRRCVDLGDPHGRVRKPPPGAAPSSRGLGSDCLRGQQARLPFPPPFRDAWSLQYVTSTHISRIYTLHEDAYEWIFHWMSARFSDDVCRNTSDLPSLPARVACPNEFENITRPCISLFDHASNKCSSACDGPSPLNSESKRQTCALRHAGKILTQ
jgi:hypothetical protein